MKGDLFFLVYALIPLKSVPCAGITSSKQTNKRMNEQFKPVIQKERTQGFPGGAVVESPPADAGDTGSCPGAGRSHVPRSGWAREPWPLSLRVRSLCSAMGEAAAVRGPRTTGKKKKFHKQ